LLEEAEVRAALQEVSALVQADGGDMELVGIDPSGGIVSLRLNLESANCAECILPKALLEDIAGGILRRCVPSVSSVIVDDPREHPDYVAESH
jgi:Fe-S cluster biogenesis protein NfuA